MMGNQEQKGKCRQREASPPGAGSCFKPAPEPGPRPLACKARGQSFGSKKRVCAPGLPVCAGLQRAGWEKGKLTKREMAVAGRLAQEAPSSARGGTWEAGRGPLSGWTPSSGLRLSTGSSQDTSLGGLESPKWTLNVRTPGGLSDTSQAHGDQGRPCGPRAGLVMGVR